eukprot:gene5181-33576_t
MRSISSRRATQVTTRPRVSAPRISRAACVVVKAHGHGGANPHGGATGVKGEKGEKEKGFINDMRRVAMKLHTKGQAPKEGEVEDKPAPGPWTPTRPGYLRFLSESKAVYEVLEKVMQEAKLKQFRNTGLERSGKLAEDIKWYEETHGLQAPPLAPDGPGATYAKMMAELAETDPQAFIAHY